MKTKIFSIILFSLMLICTLIITNCYFNSTSLHNKEKEAIEKEIDKLNLIIAEGAQQYHNNYVEKYYNLLSDEYKEIIDACGEGEYTISSYYGKYESGAVALNIGIWLGVTCPTISTETVAGYTFVFPNLDNIDVYYNGKIYSLEKAYENGWLTIENIRDIHCQNVMTNIYLIEFVYDEYEDIDSNIIVNEYGEFGNGVQVVELRSNRMIREDEGVVADFSFLDTPYNHIFAFVDGDFMSLYRAYEYGYLTSADIAQIYEEHISK